MITPKQAIQLVRDNAVFGGHSVEALNCGAIPFATVRYGGEMGQVQYVHALLRQCGCPEEWKSWVTGQFVERPINSVKDLSKAEASAVIDFLVVGSDGRGAGPGPCAEAKEVIGLMLEAALEHVTIKQGREVRIEVYSQPGLC